MKVNNLNMIEGFKSNTNFISDVFEKNMINLIYGTNGSGKSSYIRILKSLASTQNEDSHLLCKRNIDANEDDECTVKIEIDSVEYSYLNDVWDKTLNKNKRFFIYDTDYSQNNIAYDIDKSYYSVGSGADLTEVEQIEKNILSILTEKINKIKTELNLSDLNDKNVFTKTSLKDKFLSEKFAPFYLKSKITNDKIINIIDFQIVEKKEYPGDLIKEIRLFCEKYEKILSISNLDKYLNLNEEFLDDLNKSIAIAGNFVYLTNVSFQEFYNVGFRLLEYREKNTCPFCLTKKDMDNLKKEVNEESNRLLNNEKYKEYKELEFYIKRDASLEKIFNINENDDSSLLIRKFIETLKSFDNQRADFELMINSYIYDITVNELNNEKLSKIASKYKSAINNYNDIKLLKNNIKNILKKEIFESTKIVENMNDLFKNYNLKYLPIARLDEKNNKIVIEYDEKIINILSGGEKHSLTFIYFLSYVRYKLSNSDKIDNYIIIDDPIDGFDNYKKYVITYDIVELLKYDSAKVIVLTHSLDLCYKINYQIGKSRVRFYIIFNNVVQLINNTDLVFVDELSKFKKIISKDEINLYELIPIIRNTIDILYSIDSNSINSIMNNIQKTYPDIDFDNLNKIIDNTLYHYSDFAIGDDVICYINKKFTTLDDFVFFIKIITKSIRNYLLKDNSDFDIVKINKYKTLSQLYDYYETAVQIIITGSNDIEKEIENTIILACLYRVLMEKKAYDLMDRVKPKVNFFKLKTYYERINYAFAADSPIRGDFMKYKVFLNDHHHYLKLGMIPINEFDFNMYKIYIENLNRELNISKKEEISIEEET